MFRFLLLISVFLLTFNAQAYWGTSKEALINQVENLGDEVADHDHEQIYLKYTYFWLKNTNRLLNLRHMKNRMRVPSEVTDAHLMAQMQKIVRKLERRRRLYFFQKFYVKYILQYLMIQLKSHRVNPMLLAQLEISGDDPFLYGGATGGTTPVAFFTLTNIGDIDATNITEISLDSPFQFENGTYPGTQGTCEQTLLAGDSCIIVMQFLSPLIPGEYSALLTFQYFNGAENQTVTKNFVGFAN